MKSKQKSERNVRFAKGGAANRMLGKGDRTRTAGPRFRQHPSCRRDRRHKTPGKNPKRAAGGSKPPRRWTSLPTQGTRITPPSHQSGDSDGRLPDAR